MKRVPLKPGKGFARPTLERKPQPKYCRIEGQYATMSVKVREPVAVPKTAVAEHEGYRRLVAALACARCGIEGYSQAAHPNAGKTKGRKADDRLTFPLCSTRPLIVGCHYMHDQHQLFARGERGDIEQDWGRRTRETILNAGKYPANLPRWED